MSEPVTTAASVVTTNVISTAVTGAGVIIYGVHTGLDYPTLIAGVIGGATALSYQEPSKPWIRAFQVITAALFAGYASPLFTGMLIALLGKWSLVDQKASAFGIGLCVAFVTAYLTHGVLLPGFRRVGNALIGKYSQ
jgi:hypothetical protein